MSIRSQLLLIVTIILSVFLTSVKAESPLWPLEKPVDLSSGFGDYRDSRFHMGVDLRTGGKIGKLVRAPVSGYIMRVKTSYYGYGKAIYLRGDDNFIYVFAHLAKFSDKIADPVTSIQIKTERYYQDIKFPKDSITISKGELIGYSGQTGAGAPHLHFEKRTSDNKPLNPLGHGFDLPDNIAPIFERISFKQVDENSLFDDGSRKLTLNTIVSPNGNNKYTIDTIFYFNRPFGLSVDVFDMMRSTGMRQSVNKLTFLVDGNLQYQVINDTLEFERQSAVKFVYDYEEAVQGNKRVRALFEGKGNILSNNQTYNSNKGVYGWNGSVREKIGLKKGIVIAEDNFGNKSTLEFDFIWGPEENIFALDSIVKEDSNYTHFYFTPDELHGNIEIDSVNLFMNRGNNWGKVNGSKTELSADGKLKGTVKGIRSDRVVIRLIVYAANKAVIKENVFSGLRKAGKPNFKFAYSLVQDGIKVNINFIAKHGAESRIELYYQGKLLGVEYPRYFSMKEHICLIPPRDKYERIDKIAVASSTTDAMDTSKSIDCNIFLVGDGINQNIKIDSTTSLYFPNGTFAKNRFIETNSVSEVRRSLLKMNSDYYTISPELFITQKEFQIIHKFPRNREHNKFSGISWFDNEDKKWIWLENERDSSISSLTAGSVGGGLFAVKIDRVAPKIVNLNIKDGRTYRSQYQRVKFGIVDSLSGIDDDLDIRVEIDGKWQIVEYDQDNMTCEVRPRTKLKNGKHLVGIILTDRAGNKNEQYFSFYVKTKKAMKRGKGK